ncbi:NAD-dependent epimerase/dehydratase family protein [bacterium]|nr:NAD-dependent epimerase/dehydratase family protein [bacterium]
MIALTGCSGFIGRHVLRMLVPSGIPLKVLVRDNRIGPVTPQKNTIDLIQGDLLEPETLTSFCARATIIVHIAGTVKATTANHVFRINREGTQNLLDQARNQGVRRIIYVSSGAVDFLKGEYARSKGEAEQLVKSSGLEWVIVRPSEIYGPGDRAGITTLVSKIAHWPVFPIIGDGLYTLQPLHVEDLAWAIVRCIERFETCRGQIINLAGPDVLSYRDLIKHIAAALDRKGRTVSLPVPWAMAVASLTQKLHLAAFIDKEQIQRVLVAKHWDITRAQRLLDFQPRSFEQGIKEVVANKEL